MVTSANKNWMPLVSDYDIDHSLTKSLVNIGKEALLTVKTHKFKSFLILSLLLGTYKTYGLYKAFVDMTGGTTEKKSDDDTQNQG